MVADLKIRDVPRTLVKVPGSGRSQGFAGPAISYDLGRVSSLAATIPVNPYLPASIRGTQLLEASPPNNLVRNKLATSQVMIDSLASPSRRRPISSEAEAEITQESKRPRLGVHTTSRSVTNHRRVRGDDPSRQPVVVPAGTQSIGGREEANLAATRRVVTAWRTRPKCVPSPDSNNKSVEDLLEEQKNLREENRMLQLQLAYYTQMRQARQRCLRGIVP